MKNILLLFLVFFYATSSVAQLFECPVTLNSNGVQPPMSIFDKSVQISNSTDKYVFNVKFHIVKNNDGSGVTAGYGENEVMNAITIMNTNFNPFNIFFKYIGYDTINNTSFMKVRAANFPNTNLTHPTFDQLLEYSKTGMTNPVYDYEAMNLFIVEGLDYNALSPYNTMVAGAAKMPGIDSIYGYNHFLSPVLPHEIAHNFFLLHTHEQFGTPNCERVANYGDLLYNSDTNGDLVEDTKASFMFGGNFANPVTCTFQNTNNPVLDCQGTPYVNVPVRNYMTSMNSCQNLGANYMPGTGEFTAGQGIVMRNTIALYYNHTSNFYGLSNAKNTIESLYEPFVVNGGSGGNGNTTTAYSKTYAANSTSTGANVWNCGPFTMRFQTGFDCEFYTQIGTVNQTPYQHYDGTTSTQIGLKIPILGQDIYTNYAPVCFYSFEPFTSGDVKSLSNLGSGVYTQEQLDEIKASDPELYEKLQSGKYHIITKQTDSGFIDQKIIYKN